MGLTRAGTRAGSLGPHARHERNETTSWLGHIRLHFAQTPRLHTALRPSPRAPMPSRFHTSPNLSKSTVPYLDISMPLRLHASILLPPCLHISIPACPSRSMSPHLHPPFPVPLSLLYPPLFPPLPLPRAPCFSFSLHFSVWLSRSIHRFDARSSRRIQRKKRRGGKGWGDGGRVGVRGKTGEAQRKEDGSEEKRGDYEDN